MNRKLVLIGLAVVITSACSDTKTPSSEVSSASELGGCIATADDLYKLRDTFKSAAIDLARGIETKRDPLESPFVEPPSIRHTTNLNPRSTEYYWTVKIAEGCTYAAAKAGYKLDEVEFSAKLNEAGKITDDNMHVKISQE